MEDRDGNKITREKGTPQGGVVSPLLANLFLHYVFDKWIRNKMPKVEFCRYADDGILHCQTEKQAEYVLEAIENRFEACGLTINKEKSGIIYCKDQERREKYKRISFDFLGYTFRPRRSVNKQGRVRTGFLPAMGYPAYLDAQPYLFARILLIPQVAMKNRDTHIAELCKELKISRQSLYRYVSPTGELREYALNVLNT